MNSDLTNLLRESSNPALTKLVGIVVKNTGALDSVKQLSQAEKQELIDLVSQLHVQVQEFANGATTQNKEEK